MAQLRDGLTLLPTPAKCKVSNELTRHLLCQLNHQRSKIELCDVSIICQDEVFPAHKCVLASVSPYFYKLFVVELGDGPSEIWETRLEEFDPSSVQFFLDIVYGQERDFSDIDLFDFLQLVDFTLTDQVLVFIELLIRSSITVDNCLQLYSTFHDSRCPNLLSLISAFIASNLRNISSNMMKSELSDELLLKLFESEVMSGHMVDLTIRELEFEKGRLQLDEGGQFDMEDDTSSVLSLSLKRCPYTLDTYQTFRSIEICNDLIGQWRAISLKQMKSCKSVKASSAMKKSNESSQNNKTHTKCKYVVYSSRPAQKSQLMYSIGERGTLFPLDRTLYPHPDGTDVQALFFFTWRRQLFAVMSSCVSGIKVQCYDQCRQMFTTVAVLDRSVWKLSEELDIKTVHCHGNSLWLVMASLEYNAVHLYEFIMSNHHSQFLQSVEDGPVTTMYLSGNVETIASGDSLLLIEVSHSQVTITIMTLSNRLSQKIITTVGEEIADFHPQRTLFCKVKGILYCVVEVLQCYKVYDFSADTKAWTLRAEHESYGAFHNHATLEAVFQSGEEICLLMTAEEGLHCDNVSSVMIFYHLENRSWSSFIVTNEKLLHNEPKFINIPNHILL